METVNSAPKIFPAMVAIMRDMKAIKKDGYNQGQKFKFRGIDDVYNTLNPILAEHGVFIAPEVLETTREERQSKSGGVMAHVTTKVRYAFYAEDGSSVSCIVTGEGMDSGDKATPKALSIAMKYALFQTFCIPTEDIADPDADSYEVAPKQAAQQPRQQAPRQQQPEQRQEQLVQGKPVDTVSPTMRKLFAVLGERGFKKREDSLAELTRFFGRQITSRADLTDNEASEYIHACETPDNPY